MTLREHLELEKDNTDKVFLWPEGIFYKAYERSAYIICEQYMPMQVSMKSVKYLGGTEVVSPLAFRSPLFPSWRPSSGGRDRITVRILSFRP